MSYECSHLESVIHLLSVVTIHSDLVAATHDQSMLDLVEVHLLAVIHLLSVVIHSKNKWIILN